MHEINILLHSILDIITNSMERPWQIPQDDNRFDLLFKLLKIRKWGIPQKEKMGKWKNQ